MAENLVARATTVIPAPPDAVWTTLVDPSATWMVGATVSSTYAVGAPITFDGQWEGRPFQDRGEILEIERPRLLRYTHYSPLSGLPDVPESYHRLTFTLTGSDGPDLSTTVTLEQDGNASADEVEHATGLWEQVLGALRAAVAPDAGGSSPT